MIVKQYIKDFENLGFGLFVHFGLYSMLESGEWTKRCNGVSDEEYEILPSRFCPKENWADTLAATAKRAGCRYITLTCRHHDGFSLYDTRGLSDYDAPHSLCGRDLIAEFVAACKRFDLTPFFYHTLIDWHEKTYTEDFSAYLVYLRKSVEILCTRYGKIGGFWFDGMWEQPDADWQEDDLYGTIRKYQPEAMIINNTGMVARGKTGHIEIDSVTFERGKPRALATEDTPKYLAAEMCEVLCNHWGYAKRDLHYKSPAQIIEELAECRKYGANFLLNVGPMADGTLRPIDAAYLDLIGNWTAIFAESIRFPRPTDITIEGKEKDFLLKNENTYYLFCFDLSTAGDENVALAGDESYEERFAFDRKIKTVFWLDNKKELPFEQKSDRVKIMTEPYEYGTNLVVRVAKIICDADGE